jgi:hypothetical protein
MASKYAVPAEFDDGLRAESPARPTVLVKIEGLKPHSHLDCAFHLQLDEDPIHIDYSTAHADLMKQGVDPLIVNAAIEMMAKFVHVQSLAKIIAKRMEIL